MFTLTGLGRIGHRRGPHTLKEKEIRRLVLSTLSRQSPYDGPITVVRVPCA